MAYEEFRDWLFNKITETYPGVVITALGKVHLFEVVALQLASNGGGNPVIISPTEWYEYFSSGVKMSEIWRHIQEDIDTNNENNPAVKILDINWVMDNIELDIVCAQSKDDSTQNYISRRNSESDLEIIPVVYAADGDDIMVGKFDHSLLELYGKSEDELFEIALNNMLKKGPKKLDNEGKHFSVGPAVYGCVPELMDTFLDKIKSYYVLPLSIYYVEIIEEDMMGRKEAREYMAEIKELLKFLGILKSNEELSKKAYIYKDGKLEILQVD